MNIGKDLKRRPRSERGQGPHSSERKEVNPLTLNGPLAKKEEEK
jgi:hypothetical protein